MQLWRLKYLTRLRCLKINGEYMEDSARRILLEMIDICPHLIRDVSQLNRLWISSCPNIECIDLAPLASLGKIKRLVVEVPNGRFLRNSGNITVEAFEL